LSFTAAYGQSNTIRILPPIVTLYELPAELFLCGERVPMERQDIRESADEALIYSVYNQARVIMWIKRAYRYFPYIEKRLREMNMPDDIKYVAVQESSLQTYALSSAKAAGPWQFINSTAIKYGLRVDSWIDERRHFERSTDAALNYLSDLYKRFGSWNLAIAAYNCGENGLSRRKDQQGSRYFYDTDLPPETEKYIFRILAAKLILSSPETYGYAIPERYRYPPLEYDAVEIDLPREMPITTIARAGNTTFKTIREMNPEIIQNSLPAGRFKLRIPKGCSEKFKAAFGKAASD
ncbi:MAG: lytic transglycosylase domain-containing protein, partial [Syntrophales bacterium]|nr:lytic transglycosylase domain-containing protein [Syntrophales bacterium]